nr:hypothetical protein GCM10020063_059020 [Dactylosporangium thailandense]
MPEEPLGFVLAAVGSAASSAFEAALAGTGPHPRHFAVLRGLRDAEAQWQQQLAHDLGIPASRVVGAARRPGAPRLRVAPRVADRPPGQARRPARRGPGALGRLTALAGRSQDRLTAGLTDAEQAELRRLLGIVHRNAAAEPEGVRGVR